MIFTASNRPAIRLKDKTLTYADLERLVFQEKDPPLTFVAGDPLTSIIYFFALWRQGKAACPLNHRLPEQTIKEQALKLAQVPGGIATCLFTSGTTGTTKIAMHTLENHLASAEMMVKRLDLTPNDVYKLNLPLHHVAGIAAMLRTFLAGATLALDDSWEGVTHLSLVPTQLLRNLPLPKTLKVLLLGGAPIPPELITEKVVVSYGMTEMSSTIATNGILLPQTECKIGENGEILVRGPTLFAGYLGLKSPIKEGWLHTKDRGEFEEGRLQWLGRLDRQFISGGENIQPEEIENALIGLNGITKAQVRGRKDPEFGMVPEAMITSEISYSLEEIRELLSDKLPRYKLPKKLIDSTGQRD